MTRNDVETNGTTESIGRRTTMVGIGGTLVGSVGLAGCLSSTESEDDNEEDERSETVSDDDEPDKPVPHRRDSLTEAFAADVDMDMRFTNRMQLDGDPVGGDRQRAVHITSLAEQSGDYPCLAVDLQDHEFTLDHLAGTDSLTYDFYGGENARSAVPDDVFLILKLGDKRRFVTYRQKDVGKTGQWETRDVSSEFRDDGWRAVEVDPKHIDVENETVLATTEIVARRIEDLRDADTFANVLERFGESAELEAIAVGAGRFDGGTITDHYFDNLRVGTESFDFPAMLSMKIELSPSDKTHTAALSFANSSGDEHGVSLGDIDGESVRLAAYTSIAPPLPGTDAAEESFPATNVNVTEDSAAVDFDSEAVSRLSKDGRETTILVYGAYEKEPYTFLATTEL